MSNPVDPINPQDVIIHNYQDLKEPSKFQKLKRIQFTEGSNNKRRFWDFTQGMNSVAVLIFNTDQQKLCLVKQFRMMALMGREKEAIIGKTIEKSSTRDDNVTDDINLKFKRNIGECYEFCAGLIDRNSPPHEIAVSEVKEETGYHITTNDLKFIGKYVSLASGGHSYLYYCEVKNDQRLSQGGGLESEGEFIEVVHVGVEEAEKLLVGKGLDEVEDGNLNYGAAFGMMWFLRNVYDKK